MRWGVPESGAAGGKQLLASGSFDHTVKIWDADSGACLQTLQQHQAVRERGREGVGGVKGRQQAFAPCMGLRG